MNRKPACLLGLIFFLLASPTFSYAQTKFCDLRIDIFLAHETEYPQDTPIKNAVATIVNLDTNIISNPQIIDGKTAFSKLPEASYNLVVSKIGYYKTIKQINLECKFIAENNLASETVFLVKENSPKSPFLSRDNRSGTFRMRQVELIVDGETSLFYASSSHPPPPPAPYVTKMKADYVPPILVFANEISVYERAVYLPQPVLSPEAQAINSKFLEDLGGSYSITARIEIDKAGNVKNVNVDERDSPVKELIPFVIESAKKAKFVPVKVRGKEAGLLGFINYVFSK